MYIYTVVPVFILILTVCNNITTDSSSGISINNSTPSNTNIIGLVFNTSVHMNTSIRRNMNLNICINTYTSQHTDANMNTHTNIYPNNVDTRSPTRVTVKLLFLNASKIDSRKKAIFIVLAEVLWIGACHGGGGDHIYIYMYVYMYVYIYIHRHICLYT